MSRGIRTLEDLMGRCVIDEITGCWAWKGAATKGVPALFLPELKAVRTGFFAVAFLQGRPPKNGQIGYSTCPCVNSLCLAPEHCEVGTRKQWGELMAKRGAWTNSPKRLIANRRTARTVLATLTQEQAAEIRASDLRGVDLAEKYGVTTKTISKVRRGVTWKETPLPSASVFSWRP